MSTSPDSDRQGKGTIVAGVVVVAAGVGLQALNVYSFANQAPPQFGSTADFGSTALLSGIAWLLIVSGVVLTIVGIIRYAQSGTQGLSMPSPALVGHPTATASAGNAGVASSSASVSTPAFCSACGAKLVGEGRFCAACGAPAAR